MIFCHKCGAKADDDEIICSNCGEKLILDDTEQQAAATIQTQINNIQPDIPQSQMNSSQANIPQSQRKKSRKFPIILAVIAAVIIVRIVIMGLIEDKIDYTATVKTCEFFDDMPYTFNQVFTKYIESPVWKVRESGKDTAYVDISGTTKGKEIDLAITIKVESDPDTTDGVVVTLDSVTLNGDKYIEKDDVVEFISGMFSAYDQKYDNLYDYYELYEDSQDSSNSIKKIDIGETKSYNNDYGDIKVTLDYVEFTDSVENELLGNYVYPDEGNVFLRAVITIENVGTKASPMLLAENTIVYDNIYEFNYSFKEKDITGDIKPLSSPVTGAIIFEVPYSIVESNKSLILNINDGSSQPVISYTIIPGTNSLAENKADITGSNTYNSGISDSNNAADYDILYKGIPLRSFFNQPAENVVQSLGWSAGSDRDDDIRLYTIAGDIETAEVENPALLTVNGTSLEKNRDGLIALFGEPTEESNSSGYSMRYEFPYYAMNFELGEPNSAAWRVSIYPINS